MWRHPHRSNHVDQRRAGNRQRSHRYHRRRGNPAWVALALGVITLAVGVGLLNGSSLARVLATIVFVLSVAAAVYSLFTGGTLWSAIGTGGLSLIALILLYTARSNAFFKS